MSLNNPNSRPCSPRQRHAPRDRTGTVRFGPARRRRAALVLITAICVAAAGSAPTGRKKPAVPEKPEKIDAKALTTMLQHFDKVEQEKHPWGWIRWLMSSKLDPKSKMTFGIVEINAGQTNPLHVHPNCEELIYVLSGSCEHRIGNRTVVLDAGDLLRIPTGVPHTARTSKKGPMRAVIVYSSGDRQFAVVEEKGP